MKNILICFLLCNAWLNVSNCQEVKIDSIKAYTIPLDVNYRGQVTEERIKNMQDVKIKVFKSDKFLKKFVSKLEKIKSKPVIDISGVDVRVLFELYSSGEKLLNVSLDGHDIISINGVIHEDKGFFKFIDRSYPEFLIKESEVPIKRPTLKSTEE